MVSFLGFVQTGELSFPRLFRQEEGTQKVLLEDKETTLESKIWFFFSWGCKDRRELYFPRLFRQEEWMKKVWFEDK